MDKKLFLEEVMKLLEKPFGPDADYTRGNHISNKEDLIYAVLAYQKEYVPLKPQIDKESLDEISRLSKLNAANEELRNANMQLEKDNLRTRYLGEERLEKENRFIMEQKEMLGSTLRKMQSDERTLNEAIARLNVENEKLEQRNAELNNTIKEKDKDMIDKVTYILNLERQIRELKDKNEKMKNKGE